MTDSLEQNTNPDVRENQYTITNYSDDLKQQAYVFFEKMWGQLGRPWDPANLQKDMVDIPATYQKAGGEFWLATGGGEVVGCTGLKPLEQNQSELVRFYVLEEKRGQKIGINLLNTALAYAKEKGFDKVFLDTDSKKSLKAIKMFESAGFKQIPSYKETPHSDLFMELNLKP